MPENIENDFEEEQEEGYIDDEYDDEVYDDLEDSGEEEQEEEEEEEEEKEKKKKVDDSKPKEEEFKFNASKYIKKGITDKKALAEIEKQERRVWENNKLLGKHSKEVGDSRKNVQEMQSRINSLSSELNKYQKSLDMTEEEFDELYKESPTKARKAEKEIERANEIDLERTELNNKMLLSQHSIDLEEILDDVVEILKEDLGDFDNKDKLIKEFKRNPYSWQDAVLLNISKRAILNSRVKGLENENKELKKQLKEAPNKTLSRVKMLQKNNTINSRVGVSSPSKRTQSISQSYLLNASPKQLREMLNEYN